MLHLIRKIFFLGSQKKDKGNKKKGKKSLWAEKQLREMGKLGGKLILM